MYHIFKVAVGKAPPVLLDTPKTISKLVDLTRDAAGRGARLRVRTPDDREGFRWYYDSAIEMTAPETARPSEVARHYARLDVFRLPVNTRATSAVTFDWQSTRQKDPNSEGSAEPKEDALCSD